MDAMVRRCLFALAMLLVAAARVAAQAPGTVQGRVTDVETGAPIVNAVVELVTASGLTVASTTTNSDGRYRMASVGAGAYTLAVSAIGYGTHRTQAVVGGGATVTADATVRVRPLEGDPIVVSVGRTTQKATDAPAHVEVINEAEIENRVVTTPADHLRSIAAVDIITQGVQSTNVVVRGFNNIFSGAVHLLTDNRIAGVPSLRVNVMNFIPTTNDDVQRMELVLGPGAALYGPNTADGVLHMVTKSPLTAPGTTFSIAGGERSVLNVAGRTAHRVSDVFGFKISGQYFRAEEWPDLDSTEVAERRKIDAAPAFWAQDLSAAAGITLGEAELRLGRVARRDFDIDRWSLDGRADWQVTPDAVAIFSTGVSHAGSQIELTGLGAGQADSWVSSYFQGRFNWRRLFVQAYLNASDAGDTFLLRNGAPIVDRSRLWVGQVQHGLPVGSRQQFTYGLDYIFTNPETEGTINGSYENDDQTTEFGAYVQSETQLAPKLRLVLAGRVDTHSALPDAVFSPRAALVFQPAAGQAFRLTYNRAFSTPSSLNQFLDLGTAIPNEGAARLGYSVRVQGTGETGFTFRGSGGYQMRSPFTPGATGRLQLVPAAAAAAYWQAAVQVVAAQAAQGGQPLPTDLLNFLLTRQPTPAQISSNYFFSATQSGSLADLEIPDIEPIRESTSTSYEVGYRGALGERVVLTSDVWYSKRDDLVTPLTVFTPFIGLNPQQTAAFLQAQMAGAGFPAAQIQALVPVLTQGLASVPLGVISAAEASATGPQLLATYTNVDESVDLWGIDLAAEVLLADRWSLFGSASFVNDNNFETDSGLRVFLNAPKSKASLGLGYGGIGSALNLEGRVRYTDGFPASSGVYEGTACIVSDPNALPCVDSYTLLDLSVGYRLPRFPGASVQLSVQNLLDEEYQSFPGLPRVGRLALLRLKYDF